MIVVVVVVVVGLRLLDGVGPIEHVVGLPLFVFVVVFVVVGAGRRGSKVRKEDLGHQSDGDLNESSILVIRRTGRAAGLLLFGSGANHVGNEGGDSQR